MSGYYSIVSKDKKLIEEKINNLKNTIVSEYDEIVIDLEEDSIYELVEHIETISLFFEVKFIVCKSAKMIKESNYNKNILEKLSYLLSKPLNDVLLIFVFDELDSKNKYHINIKSHTSIINIDILKNQDINLYIKNYLKEEAFKIKEDALEELLVRTNFELLLTITELNKIMTYKDEDKEITIKDIKLLVSQNIENNVFMLLEAVLEKDKPKILKVYEDMQTINQDEISLITILLNKFNEMYSVKRLLEDYMTKDDIANIFNLKPGRVYYMIKNAQVFNLINLKNNINKLSKLEYDIKTGIIDKRLGLQLYLLG